MKKTTLALLIAASFAPSLAFAEAGDWVVRLRAAHISPDEDSNVRATVKDSVPELGGATVTGDLTVDSNTIPELDISYYVTKNIALELILALGSKHDVNLTSSAPVNVNEDLGQVNVLPPTLTVQWHFRPDQMFDPYVGAGINYTRFLDKNLRHSLGGGIEVERNSWGPALQAGFDINLQDGWLINADVKKIWIETDVRFKGDGIMNAGKIDSLDVDPWVFGIGIGKKF